MFHVQYGRGYTGGKSEMQVLEEIPPCVRERIFFCTVMCPHDYFCRGLKVAHIIVLKYQKYLTCMFVYVFLCLCKVWKRTGVYCLRWLKHFNFKKVKIV